MRNRVQTTAFFFDMVVSASASRRGKPPYQGLQPMSAKKIMYLLSMLKDADGATMHLRGGRVTTYLQDLEFDDDHASFLINLCDRDAADLAFSNPGAKTRRAVVKQLEEGLDASAHVVIRLDPSVPDTYKMLIESTHGLPSSKVEQFLNYCLRKLGGLIPNEFMVEDPEQAVDADSKVKKIKARMKVRLFGHPSSTLQADINAGTVNGVELITRNVPARLWDQNGYVLETAHAIKMDTRRINSSGIWHKFGVISEICAGGISQNLETLRVKFKTAAGLNRTVLLDTATLTTNDEAYVRKELLHGFTDDLSSSYEKINTHLVARMKALT